jgi:hypothetical protein
MEPYKEQTLLVDKTDNTAWEWECMDTSGKHSVPLLEA